jgi:6-phosphogluconolactonase
MSLEVFANQEAMTASATAAIAGALTAAIEAKGQASAVVTGGSSPGPIYDRLAASAVDWRKVTVTLSDERWADVRGPDSNEHLVRSRLVIGAAAPVSFVGLKGPEPDLETAARGAERVVAEVFPTDVTLLGMGDDGHIASIFPGDPIAAYALDLHAEKRVVAVPMSGLAPFLPRLSLTLRALLDTGLVLLVVTGAAKRDLIHRVFADQGSNLPVAALLHQDRVPVRVLWSP